MLVPELLLRTEPKSPEGGGDVVRLTLDRANRSIFYPGSSVGTTFNI